MVEKKETNTPEEKAAFSRSWIRLNLGLKGFTIRSFAKQHGVKAGTVGKVFTVPYPRMERLIAHTLGLAPQEIWPSRYDENGKPNRPNLWYARKSGVWTPKIPFRDLKSRTKNLDKDSHETD